MISPSQRPVPDDTQHSQQTNIHAPGGIRIHDRSRRAAVYLRLRPLGYWDRHNMSFIVLKFKINICLTACRIIPFYPLLLQINPKVATHIIPPDLGEKSARVLLLFFRCPLISINCLHSHPILFRLVFRGCL
jgi:hypothetical protein